MLVGNFIELIEGKERDLYEILEVLADEKFKLQHAVNNSICIINRRQAVPSGSHARMREEKEWVFNSIQHLNRMIFPKSLNKNTS